MARNKTKTDNQGSNQTIRTSKSHNPKLSKARRPHHESPSGEHPSRGPAARRAGSDRANKPDKSHQARQGPNTTATPQQIPKEIVGVPSTERLAIGKRAQDGGAEEAPSFPNKQAKLNGNVNFNHPPEIDPSDNLDGFVNTSVSDSSAALESQRQALPAEVQHLEHRYSISTMSILSSSKIENRVRNLLERTARSGSANPAVKPGVVILSANAKVAGKMGSIVEIAKGEIKEENGKWWQYNKLHGELLELKPKQAKGVRDEKIVAEWEQEQNEGGTTEIRATHEIESFPREERKNEGETRGDEDEEMGEEFETMTTPRLRNQGILMPSSSSDKKVRNTPVMTIFFARVPISGLKELYGYGQIHFNISMLTSECSEQTNA